MKKRTIFWFIPIASLAVAILSLQAESPGKPGEGFGPYLDLDNDGYGVITFVAPKGNASCQKFFIEPTKAAKNENISIEIVFNPRLISNKKWEKSKEESIWTGPLDQKVSIIYDHAGHRGVHGGMTAKDTHHNWGVRLKNKTYKNLADFQKDWQTYATMTDRKDVKCGTGQTSFVKQSYAIELTAVKLLKE